MAKPLSLAADELRRLAAEGAAGAKPLRSFPAVWLKDAAMPEAAAAIIKGLLEPKTLGVIYGESASGKTFLAIDLVFHVVQGMPWRGRKVQPVLVVYIAAEAGVSILKRFFALRERKLGDVADPGPLAIITRGPNLLDQLDVDALLEQLRELGRTAGMPLGLVVFDTLSRSIPGGDENSAEDMTTLIHVADRLRDELGAATLMLHHTGKDPSKGVRGHSALFSAADLVLSVTDKVARVEKVRDGVAGEQFAFELEVVELGLDADNEPITTCVVAHKFDAPKRTSPDKVLSGVGVVALQSLREAISDGGEAMPETSTIPRGIKGVTLTQWRSRFTLRYGTDGKGSRRDDDTVERQFRRGREALLKARAVGISNPYAWLT